jgi:methyltransferase (TIGR00027 family)
MPFLFEGLMQANRFSRTAQVMAFFRALESVRPASIRLLSDSFAGTVLAVSMRRFVALSRFPLLRSVILTLVDRRWPGGRTSGIARTRLIDDWITAAVRDGARQVAILGAGFDSRAWRLSALAGIPVFEIDHPATSAEKRHRLIAAGLDPSRIVQVTLDFDREPLAETLAGHGFDMRYRTAVIWEGVTNYLTADAVDAVLRWMSSLGTGSTLAFTYVHAAVLADPTAFGAGRILAAVATAGEGWTFGMDPAELRGRLEARGLTLVEDLGADDYRSRYWPSAKSRWRGYAFYRAALATVPRHAAP